MKKYRIISLILISMMILSGCEGASGNNETDTATSAAADIPDAIDAPGFERTVITHDQLSKGKQYVHGDDGYFLLAENGAPTELKVVQCGACWVCAASTSMESSLFLAGEKDVSIDPFDILDKVYDENKEEGFFPETMTKTAYTGDERNIAEALSNGFGDYILTKALDCEGLSRNEIKEAIKNNGAMTLGMTEDHNGRFFVDGYLTQYDSDNLNFHKVALVGWDDHFPKEYFRETPPHDGAWIAQDSLTKEDYYYVSYDSSIVDAFIFEISKKYSDVASYDAGFEKEIKTGDTTTLANVFHKAGTLAAVGTFIPERGENISIKITDENTGELLLEQDASFNIRGYYTIPLEKQIDVTDYRIEITYNGAAAVEGEDWFDGFLKYHVVSKKGQSFVKLDGEWLDLSLAATGDKLGIDFKPNNACIKGLYV